MIYKELEGNRPGFRGWRDVNEAQQVIRDARDSTYSPVAAVAPSAADPALRSRLQP